MTDANTLIKQLAKKQISGRISRRAFMQQALAMGATITIASQLADQAMAATPVTGGHFRIGIGEGSTSDVLDPGLAQDGYMGSIQYAVRNSLTEIDSNDELVGELAESWEASPDAKVWTFNLRKGVEFHNGKTLTSADVVASLLHHIGEDSTSVAKGALEGIETVKADGPNTVVVELKSGNADFPYLVSGYRTTICPEKDGKPDWQSGVGTGGYIIESFEPGVVTKLKRNPNYWKEGRAHFDTIDALVISDVAARTSALRSGDLHAINRADIKTLTFLKRDKNIKVLETEGTLHYVYAMQTNTAPFDNLDVRLALKYAIDRQAFVDTILRGHGYVGNDNPIGKSNKYYADIEQRPYDPDKAKFHLKKAGHENLKLSLSASAAAFDGAVDGAVLYKEAAAPAGIDINVVREPADGYWSNVWGVKPWISGYWSGRVTEDWMFSLVYADGVPFNETKWANKRFNELLVQARVELDQPKRRDMYREMQQLCTDDCGAIIPAFGNYVFATSKNVAQGKMSAAFDMDGSRALERWWFTG